MSETTAENAFWEGFPIHVRDTGNGPTVVLLHSSGMSGDQWRRTSQELVDKGYRVVVPDLIGSGKSAPLPEGQAFSFADDVAVVTALLTKLGEPCHLVGHSYGGLIALFAALSRKDQLRSLAVYDPVTFGVLANHETDRADLPRLGAEWGVSAAEHQAWLESFVDYWGGSGAWSSLRDNARAEFVRVGWVVYEEVTTLMADTTPAEAYAVLHAPTLLITGELTPMAARKVIERLSRAIPAARLERFAGAGHMGPLTHNGLLNASLLAHFEASSTKNGP